MTCREVEQLQDAFLDAELPGRTLLDVARHAAGCQVCDGSLRQLASLQQLVGAGLRAEAERLDLSGTWPAIAHSVERADAQRAWRRRARIIPAWSIGLAAAASVFFWMQPSVVERPVVVTSAPTAAARRVAARGRDHALIESLRGKSVMARRDPKAGTIIWVNHPVGDVGP